MSLFRKAPWYKKVFPATPLGLLAAGACTVIGACVAEKVVEVVGDARAALGEYSRVRRELAASAQDQYRAPQPRG